MQTPGCGSNRGTSRRFKLFVQLLPRSPPLLDLCHVLSVFFFSFLFFSGVLVLLKLFSLFFIGLAFLESTFLARAFSIPVNDSVSDKITFSLDAKQKQIDYLTNFPVILIICHCFLLLL